MKTSPLVLVALLMTAVTACMTDVDAGDDALATASSAVKAAPTCKIDGVVYAAGATNPADACQSCDPVTSKKTWTVLDATCYDPPPPPTSCESALDCSGQACINNVCSACMLDSQCAAPLRCDAGTCVL